MLVNPAETATSASFVARAASTARGVRVISSTFRVRIPMKCPWTSHIPGIRAGTFTTDAPAAEGAPSIGPAYAIVGPSTINAAFRIGSPRPGMRTSASIRSIEFAIAVPPKNVGAARETQNPFRWAPAPRGGTRPAPPDRPRLDELEGRPREPPLHLEDDPRRRRGAGEPEDPRGGRGRDQQCEFHRVHPDAPSGAEGGRGDRERLLRGPARRADDLPGRERVPLPHSLVPRQPAGRRSDGQRNPQLERSLDRLPGLAAAAGAQHPGRRGPAAGHRWNPGRCRPADEARFRDGEDPREDVRTVRMASGGQY